MTDVGVPKRRVPPSARGGVPGVAVIGGYPQTNELSSELSGRARYRTFREVLLNTSIVAASVRSYLNLLGNAGWTVEPSKKRGGKRVAELVEDALFKDMETPWHRVVRRAAMYRFYGFSVQEWTAKRGKRGRVTYADVESRSQNTIVKWDVDVKTGEVLGVVQESPWNGVELYVPRTKLLYLVDDSLSDSPEGVGLFRQVVGPARRLKVLEDLECYGYESDLRGIPIGRAPISELRAQGWTEDEIKAEIAGIRDFLENHRRTPQLSLLLDSITYESEDESAAASAAKQYDVSLLQASTTGHEHVANAIERLNREIARSLGAESLLTGENGSGSLAMARDKSQTFALTVAASLQEMTQVFQRDLVTPLMLMNGVDESLRPELKPDAIQHRSVIEITEALRDLALAGAALDPADPVVDRLRSLMGLPRSVVVREKPAADATLDGTPRNQLTPNSRPPQGAGDGADDD
jgi:hypothetical protein